MRRLILSAPLVLLPLLAACGGPTTITAGGTPDADKEKIAAAPAVKLPPAMLASKSYRCKDNSLVYIDWFNDNVSAKIKTKKDGTATELTAPAAGQAYAGGGYDVSGKAADSTVQVTKPGGKAQPCDA